MQKILSLRGFFKITWNYYTPVAGSIPGTLIGFLTVDFGGTYDEPHGTNTHGIVGIDVLPSNIAAIPVLITGVVIPVVGIAPVVVGDGVDSGINVPHPHPKPHHDVGHATVP